MGKYTVDAKLDLPSDVVSTFMEDYFYHNNYFRTDWKGSPVYQCTDTSGKERYLDYHYTGGILHLEAWMKDGFGNANNLTGMKDSESKRAFKESLDRLQMDLRAHTGDRMAGGYIGHDPVNHYEQNTANYQNQSNINYNYVNIPGNNTGSYSENVQNNAHDNIQWDQPLDYEMTVPVYEDNSQLATVCLICGIVALCISWIVPIFAIILSIIAISRAKDGMRSSMPKRASAGKICGILAIIFSIIIWISTSFLQYLIPYFFHMITKNI